MACPRPDELARIAYEAYGEWAAWRNHAGLPMPTWDRLAAAQRLAWVAASAAVVRAILDAPPPESTTPAGGDNPPPG